MIDLKTILIAFGYIGFVIACASLISKFVASPKEVTRKFIHIMVGNWVFLYPYYESLSGLVFVPAMFIIINALSLKYALIPAMEREENDGYGTVYYAISLTLLSAWAMISNKPYVLFIGILSMAYGDGFAAIIGKKFGKNLKLKNYPDKSIPGSLVVGSVSFMVSALSLIAYYGLEKIGVILIVSIMTSLFAVFLELEGKNGIDNLSLPLGTSYIAFLSMLNPSFSYFVVFVVLLLIFAFAYMKGSITIDGIIMGLLIGQTIYQLSGFMLLMNLIMFFIIGSAISKLQNHKKQEAESLQEHTGARNYIQVCANALPSTLVVLFIAIYPQYKNYEILAYVLFATAFADTFSSEIGMLSKGKVISITRLKIISSGVSGGVSLLGTLAGIVGSIISSLFAYQSFGLKGSLFISVMGFVGMIIDSILGDVLQRKYVDSSGNFSDIATDNFSSLKGIATISNNTVNLMTLIIIMIIGIMII